MIRSLLVFGALLSGLLSLAAPLRAPGGGQPVDERHRAAARAAGTLLDTHLFAEGRGMHFAAPGVIALFRFFERAPLPVDVNGMVGRYIGANMQGRRAVGMFEAEDRGSAVVAM